MSKVLLVIAPEGYQDKELADTKTALEQSGHTSVITSTTQEAHGKLGGKTGVDVIASDVNPGDYDATVFIGGPGSIGLADDATVQDIAKNFYNAGKVVAAICAAPLLLAKIGILQGKKATCDPSQNESLKQSGAALTNKPVEVDGKIITGNGPEASYEFGKTIAQNL